MTLETVDLLEDEYDRQYLLLKTEGSTDIIKLSESEIEAVRNRLYQPPTQLTDSPTDSVD
jgi:hypothetical protein